MELRRHRTEITIETLSVTTIKKREPVQPSAYCTNCGHAVTGSKPTNPIIGSNSKMIVEEGSEVKTGEVL